MNAAGAIAAAEKEPVMIQEEIGKTAGAIWQALAEGGASTLPKLRKSVNGHAPVFDWAIGWLAREDKITITQEKRSFVVHLREM
jgi:Winged helix-turn-helix domain (DUF2582)